MANQIPSPEEELLRRFEQLIRPNRIMSPEEEEAFQQILLIIFEIKVINWDIQELQEQPSETHLQNRVKDRSIRKKKKKIGKLYLQFWLIKCTLLPFFAFDICLHD
jgi:hypothetical protein